MSFRDYEDEREIHNTMNDNYSWKKNEVVEVDLINLLLKLCRQWKQIIICAVVLACLFGGYSYLSSRNSKDSEVSTKGIELTEYERQQVDRAVELAGIIEDTQKYLDESVLMNIEPYHKNEIILLYSIDDATKSTKQKIVENYLSFLNYGGVTSKIQSGDSDLSDIDVIYLSELISAWQRTDSSNQIVINDIKAETLFYVYITGIDDKMAGELANEIQGAIDSYHETVKSTAGEHTLTLISNVQGVKADNDLAAQQRDKSNQLTNDLTALKTLTDSFSAEQKLLYEKKVPQVKNKVSTGVSIKWIVLGFMGGVFIYCGIFACFYMFRDTVKRMEELKRHYNFPIYGGIIMKKGTKGTGEDLTGKQKDEYDRQKAQMVNRVKLACQKQGFSKMCLATDFSLNQQEKSFIDSVSKQLKDWGIDIVLGENIVGNVSIWDDMKQVGNVLMVYKIGTTTHHMIDEEMCFYMENNIEVLGAVTIEEY